MLDKQALDTAGWVATAVFSCSYFCRTSNTLRRVQALAALLWVAYGVLLHAMPIVVANVIVAGAAGISSLRRGAATADAATTAAR